MPDPKPAHQPAEVFLLSGSGASITQNVILDLLKERHVVHIVPALIDAALFRYSITEVGGVPIITLSAGRLRRGRPQLKRLLDILVAAAILLICAPLMAIIGLAVKLTSPGPTFFRQERLGKDGGSSTYSNFAPCAPMRRRSLKSDPQLITKYREGNFKLAAKARISALLL